MLTLPRMQRIELERHPRGQLALAVVLRGMYSAGGLEIVVEGLEKLPQDRPVIVAMNHTDRYNYFPLQVRMERLGLRHLASWVKAKYYENPGMAALMERTANIPLASRGWVVTTSFRQVMGRPPTGEEYRQLKDLGDRCTLLGDVTAEGARAFLKQSELEDWADHVDTRFRAFAGEAVRLTGAAMDCGLHIQIFPEGTRRIRLGRGHIGLAQIAQHFGVAVVPVGCNGSHRVFPGNSPWPRRGRIVYRIGDPISVDDPAVAPFRVSEPFAPLTGPAVDAHAPAFRGYTDVLMSRIAELLDPEHLPLDDDPDDGTEAGAARFV